jgi:predicted amidophosphoribosyltransferase
MFYRFKAGEEAMAYPLARGMYEALRRARLFDFDCIVPVPLSPDKHNELHRTRALAKELGRLLDVRMMELLSLREPISKRRMIADGYTTIQFEDRYFTLLDLSDRMSTCTRILLVDDVCTHGSTIRAIARRLLLLYPQMEVFVSTAGQMIVKDAVREVRTLVA